MPRIFLIAAFAFALPFLIYDVTKRLARTAQKATSREVQNSNNAADPKPIWADAPLPLLGALGAILTIATIFSLVLWSEGKF